MTITQAQILTEIATRLPTNASNAITAALVRSVLNDMAYGSFPGITRSQIPSTTIGGDTIVVSGYTTAGDVGIGAVYTSVGAGPTSVMAIQDAAGTWFRLAPQGYYNVCWFGAIGNGVNDDTASIQACFDAAFGAAGSEHGTSSWLNVPVYFPAGRFQTSAPITFKAQGARISGAGRLSTRIDNGISGIFSTNGMSFSIIEGMTLRGAFTSVVFDLNWNGVGSVTLQSNTFRDILFDQATRGASIGCRIGNGGFMGSENIFINCFWIGASNAGQYGVSVLNQNALQNTIVGGNFQGLDIAINVGAGSVTGVFSTGFQASVTCDIQQISDVSQAMVVSGCRSESTNFCLLYTLGATITGCLHSSLGNGYFYSTIGGGAFLANNASTFGNVILRDAACVTIDTCLFSRADWISAFGLRSQSQGDTTDSVIVIRNTHYDNNAAFKPVIRHQRITGGVAGVAKTRTYEIEAAALTDSNVAGYTFAAGDIIWQSAPAGGASPGWVCTTGGVAGVDAVFKTLPNLGA